MSLDASLLKTADTKMIQKHRNKRINSLLKKFLHNENKNIKNFSDRYLFNEVSLYEKYKVVFYYKEESTGSFRSVIYDLKSEPDDNVIAKELLNVLLVEERTKNLKV